MVETASWRMTMLRLGDGSVPSRKVPDMFCLSSRELSSGRWSASRVSLCRLFDNCNGGGSMVPVSKTPLFVSHRFQIDFVEEIHRVAVLF